MRIAYQLDYTRDVFASLEQVQQMEAAGLDHLWVPEVWGHDAPTLLGYLAARTTRITLGAGVLPVFTRTPALIAQTAATLDELSAGRAVLGLGSSGPQVIEGWHGVPFERPLTRMRETTAICRAVWARERLVFEGKCFQLPLGADGGTGLGKPLRLMTRPPRARIPIHLAMLGPAGVRLAAEVADGWLPLFFYPERAADVWGESLAAGGDARAGDLAPLEISAGGTVAIGGADIVDPARRAVRAELARYVGGMGAASVNFYADLVSRYGHGECATEVQRLYLSGQRAEAEEALPDALIEGTSLCGDEAHVRGRLAAYRTAGVTTILIGPSTPDPVSAVCSLRRMVDGSRAHRE